MVRAKRKLADRDDSVLSGLSTKASRQRSEDDKETLQDDSVLFSLITKAEFRIMTGDKPYQLNVDQAVFQRNLTKLLRSHPNYPEVLGEFLQDFQNHLDDPTRLKWSLMPSATSSSCTSARSENQDSLVRLLLGIEMLQELLATYLLEKIAEVAACDQSIFDKEQEINLPRLILSQFRWLDKLVNSKALSLKLMEILMVCPLDVQRDIIISIPDILDDVDHPEIACRLSELLLENHELSVAILDTLSNLNIKPEVVSEVRITVLKTLSSVNVEDLPVVVRFVLQNVNPQEAFQIINELRNNLEFAPSFPPSSSSTPAQHSSTNSSARGYEFLTLDAIRSALRFQKLLWDTWIKVIEAAKESSDNKPIDLLVLLVLRSLGIRTKQVESLLRNKIRSGHFNELFLQVTFGSHSAIIREYFSSFLAVAEVLMRSNESIISNFGSCMYQRAFIMFDTYCRQEIVGSLVTHVGGGTVIEVEAALNTLLTLVQEHMEQLSPFGTFIKSLLDHMDNLPLKQIRKIFAMLSLLAYQGRQEALLQDDMHMIIRKQLTNNNPKYRRMGVIGALMAAKAMASTRGSTFRSRSSVSTSSEESVMLEVQKEAISLLELVRKSTYKTPEAFALFCDELARIVQRGELDEKVEAWIDETLISDFQDDFIIDLEPENSPRLEFLEMEMKYGLDGSAEGGIALNLTPLIVNDEKWKLGHISTFEMQSNKHVSPLTLAPTFRLLRICEYSQHGGTLDGIDALLGCPVYLPHFDKMPKFSSLSIAEKHHICTSLFYCINWFRELVNGFALVDDIEMKMKVIQRLKDIVALQKLLQLCLAEASGYIPPMANFDCDKIDPPPSIQQSTSKTAVTKGKRGRKAGTKKLLKQSEKSVSENSAETTQGSEIPKDTQVENSCSSNTSDSQKNKPEDGKENLQPPEVNLALYQPYFRELDMDVFAVLHNGVTFENPCIESQEKNNISLQPPELQFILYDLVHKLDFSLLASASRFNPIFKNRANKHGYFSNLQVFSPSEVAGFINRLLPVLCQLLDEVNGYFQNIIAQYDGIIDASKMFTPEASIVGSCMQLLLQSLNIFFSWKGLNDVNNHKLLQDSLRVLADRLGEQTGANSKEELVKQAIKYLEKFADSVPNIHTATTLLKLLQGLINYSDSSMLKERLATTAGGFLKRNWQGNDGKKEKGALFNENIQCLLKGYLSQNINYLQPLELLATVAIPQLVKNDKEASSDFPTLTRHTFGTFYKMMHCQLSEGMRFYCSKKQNHSSEDQVEHLVQWSLAVRIFHILVNLIKVFDGRSNLGTCLKNSRQFVDIFLRHGMPLLDHLFRSQREDVQNLLKNFQLSTRYLHHICSHSKVSKDIALTKQVPFLKKTLETFVYRVKAMLALNKCKEAFWLGNLKNRDLQGEEILSQSTSVTESIAEGSDSELLLEDQSDVESDAGMDEENLHSDGSENS